MSALWLGTLLANVCVLGLVFWYFQSRKLIPLRKELDRFKKSLEGERHTLQLVASAITSSSPDHPASTLSAIVRIVAKALDADICAFLLYEESAGELIVQPGAYGLGDKADSAYRMPLNNPHSSSVRVFLTGDPFISGDALNDPQVIAAYAKRWNCRSLMVVPLTLENRRVGVMRVGKFRKNFFTTEHLELVELIAEEAAVLVESVLLSRRLAEANKRLSQVNQMKDDIVSTVSHEFKTPLTSIKGFLSLMLSGDTGELTEDQKKFLKIIEVSTDRLHSLVLDLLDLSRLESGGIKMDFEPVAVDALVDLCYQDHELQARQRDIGMGKDVPPSVPAIWGDMKWLRQAIDNLVSNAIKFTAPGGKVTISARHQGEMVRLTVEDTGMGIGQDDRDRIFERFYRARNRGSVNAPGTGLGLTIVQFIVDKHEGKVWVESELGKGSKFHCIFPIARQDVQHESEPGRMVSS